MIEKSVPAPPPTRELRGLALYLKRGDEIEPVGKGRYAVPGCSGGSYVVDLKVFTDEPETCPCPDHARHPEYTCKHLVAATIFRARRRAIAHKAQAQRTAARATGANLAPLAAAL